MSHGLTDADRMFTVGEQAWHVLSWPPQEETPVEGDNLPVQDLHHNPEANLLYVL